MDTKICPRCKQTKPLTQFGRDRSKKDGHTSRCKTCKNLADRERYRANPEKAIADKIKWNKNNRAKVTAWQKKWQQANPEKIYVYRVRERLRYPEGIRAREAVQYAVRQKKLPRANTLNCFRCGKQAREYHHHNGYAKEHWLDVVPVCRGCHCFIDHQPK